MKRTLTLLLLIAASSQLKAQQLQVMPDLKLNNGFPKNYFKADSLQYPIVSKPGAVMIPGKFNSINHGIVVYSTMPVLKLSSSSMEHMPVAGKGESGRNYTMMIERVTVINLLAPVIIQQP